jgi:outer membrane biosynthesis protein TonB
MYIILLLFIVSLAQTVFPDDTASFPPLQREPVLVKSQKVCFPLSVSRLAITGTISLQLLINEQGMVESAEVISGLHPVMDSLVVKSVSNYTFTPAMVSHEPVPVIVSFQYRITVQDLFP